MRIYPLHLLLCLFIYSVLRGVTAPVPQDDFPLETAAPDSSAPETSLSVSEALADSVAASDSLHLIPLPADSSDSVSPDSTEQNTKMKPYSTDWSWLSMGETCFADTVLLYDPGAPGAGTGGEPDPEFQDADECLHRPDQSGSVPASAALGSGGTLIIAFTDNVFFDQPGPDLYFWLPDPEPEEAQVWISQDGQVFQRAGTVSSESPFLDISGTARPGDFYTIIKIRDNPNQGDRESPSRGINIDAIAAIHTAVVEVVPLAHLFETAQTTLKPDAVKALNPVAERIHRYPMGQVLIEVYSENTGAYNYNLLLSQQQAKTIRDFFITESGLRNMRYTAIGLGNSKSFSDPHQRFAPGGGVAAVIIFK